MRILIVEDEKNIAQGIAAILKKLCPFCCSVQIASDGKEACDFYSNANIDLIITDIRMKQMDGLDMIENFYELNKKIKFIIVSGYDNFSYAQRAIRYGVVEYLLKPVDKDALLAAVQKAYESLPEAYSRKMNRTLPEIPFFQFSLQQPSYPSSLKKIIDYLLRNYMTDVSLQTISEEFMMNPNYLSSIISKYTNNNFCFLLDNIRLQKAAEFLLYDPDLSISEVSYLVGYNHERRLYQAFQKRLNCTPGEFKQLYYMPDNCSDVT